ncbi:hypothetical protein IPL68_01605 [Candidatus Saccharibacteria bacterium]|nr:MAG: hypothetical protein IPL68_01605 [Candidatus Saccharibacteria bacterium]
MHELSSNFRRVANVVASPIPKSINAKTTTTARNMFVRFITSNCTLATSKQQGWRVENQNRFADRSKKYIGSAMR